MKTGATLLAIVSVSIIISCSEKLSGIQDLSEAERASVYTVWRDVAYGSDGQQVMDLYVSARSASYGKRNFTIVFLHGGAYYLSDKSLEERYIEPYLRKGLNVVNLNYRLKRGIPVATSDLPLALNYLQARNEAYAFDLENIIVTGFSAGAHIATQVGVAQNNPAFPGRLSKGIRIAGIVNFAGPVDGLDVVEKIFVDNEVELFSQAGRALFPSGGYAPAADIAIFEPVTYFDQADPPVFLWHGGLDDQIPPATFEGFLPMLRKGKDYRMFIPDGRHSPTRQQLEEAYAEVFRFLDGL